MSVHSLLVFIAVAAVFAGLPALIGYLTVKLSSTGNIPRRTVSAHTRQIANAEQRMPPKKSLRRFINTRRGILALAGLFAIGIGIVAYVRVSIDNSLTLGSLFALPFFALIGTALIYAALYCRARIVNRISRFLTFLGGL